MSTGTSAERSARERLHGVFTDTLRDEDGESPPDVVALKRGHSPAWDSVSHMQLVAALEEAFDVQLDVDDVIDMDSYQRAVTILRRHGVDLPD